MKRRIPVFLAAAVLAGLTCGSSGREASALTIYLLAAEACPTVQAYPPLTGYPVTLDPARISMDRTEPNDPDYAARKRLLLAVYTTSIGKAVTHSGRACEPNSPDPIRLKANNGTITVLDNAGVPKVVTSVNAWYPLETQGYYRWTWAPSEVGISYHSITARDVRTALASNDERSTTGTVVVIAMPRNSPPILK